MSHQLSSYMLSGHRSLSFPHFSASLDTGIERVKFRRNTSVLFEEAKARVAEVIHHPEVSVSSYDTAWVAMVPSPNSKSEPCFPDCINWLLDNQNQDGSWTRPHHHYLLQKDVLSSTLACVLALKKWEIGEQQIRKGVHFIESHFASATMKFQISPVGFDIIFPGMLEYARNLSLNLNLDPSLLNDLIHSRDLELKRCCQSKSSEMKAYLAYLSEGIQKLQNSESVIKYQRRNGSLFNSPSTTAAAYIIHHNAGCLDYLQSALKKFGNAVPAVYPINIYAKLCTIDNLERLGISRHFRNEIQSVLEETYRCWLQGDEEIFMDACACALAFRILRMNGYVVTSDPLTRILEEDFLVSSHNGHVIDMTTTLELFKASEVSMNMTESVLQKHNLRLKHLLVQELNKGLSQSSELSRIDQEVNHVLQYPFYAILPRMESRRNIELFSLTDSRILKTSYSLPNIGNKDMVFMSVDDFNELQAIHREELKEIERWVIENRLDELKFARSKSAYCYFSAAASFFSPELSDARLSWAKNGVLTTVVDDFFDIGGSVEELTNLIQLVKDYRWVVNTGTKCSSQNVMIIFSALKRTIDEIGDKTFVWQERRVKDHVIDIWLDLLKSMLKETVWARDMYVPTMDEYMMNAYVSFALGPIVLPALYLVGPKLSEDMVHHSEYHNLFKLMGSCGRLLNDMHTHERESKDGKLNALSLYMLNSGGGGTKESAVAEMKKMIDSQRRELLRLVLERKKSVLPRECKDLFWYMSTVLHLFYMKDDGFTSQELIKVVKTIIHEPVVMKDLHV